MSESNGDAATDRVLTPVLATISALLVFQRRRIIDLCAPRDAVFALNLATAVRRAIIVYIDL